LIADICQQFAIIYAPNVEGKNKLFALEPSDSPVKTIDNTTVKMQGNDVNAMPMIKVAPVPMDTLYTNFIVNYRLNRATGNYEKQKYCINSHLSNYDPDSTTIEENPETWWQVCRDAYVKYGNYDKTLTLDCSYIVDDSTAEHLLKWLIDYFSYRKLKIEMTGFLDHVDLEVGDIVNFDTTTLEIIPSAYEGKSFMVVSWRLNPSTCEIKIDFMEIPERTSGVAL